MEFPVILGAIYIIVCLTESNIEASYFYIYDYDSWGNISQASLSKRDPYEILDRMNNSGAGASINISAGIYHTDQYQLFEIFFNRARRDCMRRTRDPSKAISFIIPYDFASDVAYYNGCPKNREHTCFTFRKCPLAPSVEELLRSSIWYQRNNGHDHLLIIGMNYAMDHYILKPKCKAFLSGICQNCTKLAIDDYSFLYGNMTPTVTVRGNYWHAVPFPADFHWTHQVQRPFPWENTYRPYLVSYLGSTHSYYGAARRLRGSLTFYCKQHPLDCISKTYGANGTRSTNYIPGYDPLILTQRSIFCFQPVGDLMTRKGLFDGILQGCIPVVFSCLTASCMYVWHWSEELWKSISIELDMIEVTQKRLDPVKYLKEYLSKNPMDVARRQELIRRHAFELQYSLEPSCANTSRNLWPVYQGMPMRDAYDIAIDHVLGWHSGRESHILNASAPHCWNGMLNVTAQPNYCMP